MEHARIGSEGYFMTIEGGKKPEKKSTEEKLFESNMITERADGEEIRREGICTIADIEALPEGERAELIDGEMFMMAAPTLTHQEILGGLSVQIYTYIKEHKGKCKVIPSAFAVYIKNDIHNYVEPDITVVCDRDKLDEEGCHGAPDWVIEIVSPSSRQMDYVRKLSLYEEAGVREYWIVDAKQQTITVYDFEHQKEAEQYTFAEKVKAGIYEDLFLDFRELE